MRSQTSIFFKKSDLWGNICTIYTKKIEVNFVFFTIFKINFRKLLDKWKCGDIIISKEVTKEKKLRIKKLRICE